MVKNLIFLRKFTIENFVSVTFDAFDFTMKDFNTGAFIQRYDSDGDLYPILPPPSSSLSATTCVVVSLPTWHRRLGHPDSSFL